jgi:protein FAM50
MAFFPGKLIYLFEKKTKDEFYFVGATKDQMRADQLLKRRQQEHEQMEMKKKKIEEENRMQAIEEKFKAHYDAVEQMLKTDTVGLVSLDEMKKKQEEIIHAREQQLAREKEAKLSESMKNKLNNRKDNGAHQRPNKLSFADEWEEEDEEAEEIKNEEVGFIVRIFTIILFCFSLFRQMRIPYRMIYQKMKILIVMIVHPNMN